ncbi:unnamed protein product [Ilex paraguariensis]|uniref:Transmembrane protein n=1 Tax=Ilex paraguariensis TaxID=185542 RepID=A0ABC8UBD9_9AQUA
MLVDYPRATCCRLDCMWLLANVVWILVLRVDGESSAHNQKIYHLLLFVRDLFAAWSWDGLVVLGLLYFLCWLLLYYFSPLHFLLASRTLCLEATIGSCLTFELVGLFMLLWVCYVVARLSLLVVFGS